MGRAGRRRGGRCAAAGVCITVTGACPARRNSSAKRNQCCPHCPRRSTSSHACLTTFVTSDSFNLLFGDLCHAGGGRRLYGSWLVAPREAPRAHTGAGRAGLQLGGWLLCSGRDGLAGPRCPCSPLTAVKVPGAYQGEEGHRVGKLSLGAARMRSLPGPRRGGARRERGGSCLGSWLSPVMWMDGLGPGRWGASTRPVQLAVRNWAFDLNVPVHVCE